MDQSERLLEQEEAELGLLRPTGPDAMLSWRAKHPASCPMCGQLYSVHEKLGGCPYYNPELEEEEMKTCKHCEGELTTKEEEEAGIHKECATETYMEKQLKEKRIED